MSRQTDNFYDKVPLALDSNVRTALNFSTRDKSRGWDKNLLRLLGQRTRYKSDLHTMNDEIMKLSESERRRDQNHSLFQMRVQQNLSEFPDQSIASRYAGPMTLVSGKYHVS